MPIAVLSSAIDQARVRSLAAARQILLEHTPRCGWCALCECARRVVAQLEVR